MMWKLSESTVAPGSLPTVHKKIHGEESTDEGSASSDGESLSCPLPAKDVGAPARPTAFAQAETAGGAFSRAALQERGRAALARLQQAQLESQDIHHDMTANSHSFPMRAQWYPDTAFGAAPEEPAWEAQPWGGQAWECKVLMAPPGLEGYVPKDENWGANDASFFDFTGDASSGALAERTKTSAAQPMKVTLPGSYVQKRNVDLTSSEAPASAFMGRARKKFDPALHHGHVKMQLPEFLPESLSQDASAFWWSDQRSSTE